MIDINLKIIWMRFSILYQVNEKSLAIILQFTSKGLTVCKNGKK